jgi:predicted chitinase
LIDLLQTTINAVAPHADVAKWASALAPFMTAGGITTPRRIAAFVGQVAWESTQFTQIEENLNYSAERLMAGVADSVPRTDESSRFARTTQSVLRTLYMPTVWEMGITQPATATASAAPA